MNQHHRSHRPLDGDGAAGLSLAALEDGLTVPIPDLARPSILEHNRQVAEAAARRDAYLAGVLAGLGIPADQAAQFDLDSWTIRLPVPRSSAPADGR